jgi:cation diffusion facilitator CzcD-associated flavoprotein CzcO
MASMQKVLIGAHATNGTSDVPNGVNETSVTNGVHATASNSSNVEELDALVVGAGFAGVYLLHQLRKKNFKAKIVEAGSGLGGIWHWNAYPGARVDSQYPIYALSLPEVYEDWTWSSHYPDHVELREYFEHVDKKLHIKKDTVFNAKVTAAEFNEKTDKWTIHCDSGKTFRASFFIAAIGFAARRHFPDWEGLDTFKGVMHHSSFWPHEGVDVHGKRVAVIGTGATGVQIAQEWAKEIGESGDLKVFQRTPNLACPMRQVQLTPEEQAKDKLKYPELFNERWNNYNGFLYQYRPLKMFDHTPEERQALFDELWNMV